MNENSEKALVEINNGLNVYYMMAQREISPETKLILAIIEQAIIDSKFDPSKYKDQWRVGELLLEKERAINWIASESGEVMSFCWYCELINLDPGWIRKLIKDNRRLGKADRRPTTDDGVQDDPDLLQM